jgi:uncharacterized membrane protein YccC
LDAVETSRLQVLPRPRELTAQLRSALVQAGRLDRSGADLRVGLRVGAAVVIALIIGKAAGDVAAEASLGAGALLVGVTAAGAGGRASVRSLVLVALSLAVSTFVGSSTSEIPWVHTLILAPWCLVAGVLMGLRPPAFSMGTQGLAAMIVFGRFAEPPRAALHLAGFVLGGGAVAVAVVVLTQMPVTGALQRRAVADALRALAAALRAPSGQRRGLPIAEAVDAAEETLAKGVVYDADQGFRSQALLDMVRRARLELLSMEGACRRLLRHQQPEVPAEVDERLGPLAADVEALADALAGGHSPAGTTQDPRPLPTPDDPALVGAVDATDRHLAALAGQLRALADLVRREVTPGRHRRFVASTGRRRVRAGDDRLGDLLDDVRAQGRLSSPVGRHALRLTVVVFVAELIARHGPVQRGYWIALTASVVLRPEFSVTFSRGMARMLGTCVGVLVGGLVGIAIHGDAAATIVAIGLFCAAAGSSFQVGYALFTAFLTSLVVLLVGLVSPATLTLAGDRLLDTIIGGVLALVAFALWPTWGERQASVVFADLVARLRAYVGLVLATVAGDEAQDEGRQARLARQVRLGMAAAQDAYSRAEAEPRGRTFRSETGRGLVAGLTRVVLATHALRADLRNHLPAEPVPEVTKLASGLDDALRQVGEAFAVGGGPPIDLPPLREEHHALVAAVADRADAGGLLAETDELVDAVDTVAGLLGPAGV